MYEAAYPLIVVSPILVYALSRRLNRRFWKTVRYWYLLPALNLIRYAYILVFKAEALDYQAGITQLDGLDNILSSLLNVYKQHFLSGWTSNTFLQNSGWFSGAGLQNWNFLPYALVVGLLIFAVCLWLSKREDFKRPLSSKLPSKHQGIVLAVVGLGIILLSVAVYLPTSARDSHLRTYYTSVIGASLTIAVMLSTLTKNRLFFASTIAMLGALGCLRLLEQGNAYVQDSEQQQQLVLDTVKLVPNLPPYTGLIVLDETVDQRWKQVFHGDANMRYPFILTYREPGVFVGVCPSEEEPAPRAICEYQEERLHVHPYDNPEWSLPYERLIFLRYQADGQLSLIGQLPNHPEYNPYNIIQPDVPPSSHIYRMFGEPAPAS